MEVDVSVLVDTGRDLAALRRELERHGLNDPAVLEGIGQITGRVDESQVDELRRVSGVESVERLGSKRAI